MEDKERSKEQLTAALAEQRAELAELRAREQEWARIEGELRRELRLVSENAKATGHILRSTVELTNQATAELKRSKRRAEAAALAKSRFLANMSHELRTPMTSILGYTDLLLEEGDIERAPASRIEKLRTLKRNGGHLMAILNDILDLSKIEAGAIDAERVAASPQDIVDDVEGLMRTTAEAKGLSLEICYQGLIPSIILTDPTRLRQVLMNLVGNAIKFTDRGGVRVKVQFDPPPDADLEGTMRFTVVDTGCGIAPEAMERIFGAFSQADASTTRQFGGTGLGLTISKQLAELLGGGIEVASTEGEGSTFLFTTATGPSQGAELITVKKGVPSPSTERCEDDSESTLHFMERVRLSAPGLRVLLVEDGEDNRRLITLTLQKAGLEVAQAENGREGVDLAQAARLEEEPFDVILMDMQMPILDGYGATRELREAGFETPIVALTAHAMAGDRERCLEAGCTAFATKPISRKELIQQILDLADKPEP